MSGRATKARSTLHRLQVDRWKSSATKSDPTQGVVTGQGRANLGLGLACRAIRRDDEAALEFERAGDAIARLDAMGRRSEAALVHACQLVIDRRDDEAATALEQALATAAPGPFGWSIPVEPFLARAVNSPAFARVRAILAERAS